MKELKQLMLQKLKTLYKIGSTCLIIREEYFMRIMVGYDEFVAN